MNMDFETNRKFFDLKHRKKVRIMKRIGAPIALVGAVLLGISSIGGFDLIFLMIPAWILLIIGVPILAIASSWRVKEADILDIVERERKQFKQDSEEKLGFPGDLAANALLLTGCDATVQKDNGLPAKKLKSGAILAPVVTFTHLYIKRDRVIVFTRHFAITEEYTEETKTELRFSEFDKTEVVPADNGDCKGYSFRFLNKGEVIFAAPVQLDDYTIDSYAENIIHTKERVGRR